MRRRSSGGSTLAMSWPSTTMRPLLASIIRLIMRRVVVLPQPDGPTRDGFIALRHLEVEAVDGRGATGEALGDGFEADQLLPLSSLPDPKWSPVWQRSALGVNGPRHAGGATMSTHQPNHTGMTAARHPGRIVARCP